MPTSPISIFEQVEKNVRDTLATVSDVGGYPMTLIVEGVEPGIGNRCRQMLATVRQGAPAPRPESTSVSKSHWNLPFEITVEVYVGDTAVPTDPPVIAVLNQAYAAVTYALCQNENTWCRGGLAVDTTPEVPEFNTESTTERGGSVVCKYMVWVITAFCDPFNQ